jgi:hypothetical protein
VGEWKRGNYQKQKKVRSTNYEGRSGRMTKGSEAVQTKRFEKVE